MSRKLIRVLWTLVLTSVLAAMVGGGCYFIGVLRLGSAQAGGVQLLQQMFLLSFLISCGYTLVIMILLYFRLQKK